MRIRPLDEPNPPRYAVVFHEKAVREFEDLPDRVQDRMGAAIDGLRIDPFRGRPGVDILKLDGTSPGCDLYRLRVGDHRAIYTVDAEGRVVLVVVVDDRETGYGRLVVVATGRLG